jgi:pilus assembly protein FimV
MVDTDSLEFDVKLTDSMFLGQPMGSQEFDIGSINLDLAAAPAEDAPVHNEHWEEVNTKLDLAKAYEEMGDLEGARELLQEVLGEGSVDLVEQARTILARIGG